MSRPLPPPLGILRSSQAPRWGNCHASFALESLFPEAEDSPEAREGTAAHFYVTEYLLGRVQLVGTVTPNGVPLDADMLKHGQLYIDNVMAELPRFPTNAAFKVETKVAAHGLIHPECEGTPDTYLLSIPLRRLIVWDYKYGHGFVQPWMNWQLIAYVAGIFEAYELTLADVTGMAVSLRVVQPRNYSNEGNVRVWDTTGEQLWELIEILSRHAYAAKTLDAAATTGAHCTDCNGRHACEAFMKVAARAVDMAGEATPHELTNEALGQELMRISLAIKRLEARKDGLAAMALSIFDRGGDVPFFEKGYVNSQERWRAAEPEVIALGDALGVDLREGGVIKVGAAKTKWEAAGLPPEVLKGYYEKPSGAAKLTMSDASRAARIFSK